MGGSHQSLRGAEPDPTRAGGTRISRSRTRYFDTPQLHHYHLHQTGRATRSKVRVRSCSETGATFVEVKQKTNKGRTIKTRTEVDAIGSVRTGLSAARKFPGELAELTHGLVETVDIRYSRITLVGKVVAERVTFDLFLVGMKGERVKSYPGAVIAEVKQERAGRSPFVEAIRRHGIREGEMCKYCLVLASLEPGLRQNRFKIALRRIEAIARGAHAHFESPEESTL